MKNISQLDLAIYYNAKLKEVKVNLEKLGELDVNLTKATKKLNSIQKNTKRQIKEADDLNPIYNSAIEELEELNMALKEEYEVYYKIDVLYKDLIERIKDVDENSINQIVSMSNTLLDNLRTSTTIDFEEEKDLVNNVYKAIYKVIKLELMYSVKSTLLNRVREDSIDAIYITELIKEDINDVKDNKDDIDKILSEIEKQGLDDSFLLNRELIEALFLHNNKKFDSKKVNAFLDNVSKQEERYDNLEKLSEKYEYNLNNIEKLKLKRRKIIKRSIKRKLAIAANVVMLGAGITGITIGSKNMFKEKYYLTTTTVYDTSKDEPEVTKEYSKTSQDNISIVEYSPWDNPGYFRDGYTRNVYTYTISNDNKYEDASEYLTEDLKDNVSCTKETEFLDEKPEDYGYPENKYVVTKVEKNEDDYQYKNDVASRIVCVFALSAAIGAAQWLIFSKVSNDSLKSINKDKRESIERLERAKENLIKLESQKIELSDEIEKSSKSLIDEYYSLPVPLMKTPEVQKAKEKVNKYIKDNNSIQ